ncbi:hypothetical protein, partial [Amycolatopsis dongchuanensis]|uniref:hypothetical protein n=1 Tax=Amycolatopsis dongchuanensis TaxID=1070866 RepID=UPI0031F8499A
MSLQTYLSFLDETPHPTARTDRVATGCVRRATDFLLLDTVTFDEHDRVALPASANPGVVGRQLVCGRIQPVDHSFRDISIKPRPHPTIPPSARFDPSWKRQVRTLKGDVETLHGHLISLSSITVLSDKPRLAPNENLKQGCYQGILELVSLGEFLVAGDGGSEG